MAKRPFYIVKNSTNSYITEEIAHFEWFSGFSISQKQKSVNAFHNEILKLNPTANILEISTKSPNNIGVSLSAFNLSILGKNTGKSYSVESMFQASKLFENGGPYKDLLDMDSRAAKKDVRLKQSGKLIGFAHGNYQWALEPKTLFYDWLYINALSQEQNKYLASEIMNYTHFTDIEFNPDKSINCQAKSAALFVSLHNNGLLEKALSSNHNYVEVILSQGKSSSNIQQLSIFDEQ